MFAGLPLGLWSGLRLACMKRDQLAARLRQSEKLLVLLATVSVSGCVLGVLEEDRELPLLIGMSASAASLLAIAWILLRGPRKSSRKTEHRRGDRWPDQLSRAP